MHQCKTPPPYDNPRQPVSANGCHTFTQWSNGEYRNSAIIPDDCSSGILCPSYDWGVTTHGAEEHF
jgi:hypothetical protein